MHEIRAGFLSLNTIDILYQVILCHGGCPVCCRIVLCVLSSTPGFCPQDTSSTPSCDHQKYLQALPDRLADRIAPDCASLGWECVID